MNELFNNPDFLKQLQERLQNPQQGMNTPAPVAQQVPMAQPPVVQPPVTNAPPVVAQAQPAQNFNALGPNSAGVFQNALKNLVAKSPAVRNKLGMK